MAICHLRPTLPPASSIQRYHPSHCFSVGGIVATRSRLPPFLFETTCHLPSTLPPCHLHATFYATRPRLPPFHFGCHLRWLFATFVRPCHLPPPCNVATYPTVSQWVASSAPATFLFLIKILETTRLPCHLPPPMPVRACHLSFPYQDLSDDSTTLPPATSNAHPRLQPFHFGYHLRWLFATFVRPCHLPPPCNVATHPTVSQWVASLPLVRACHLSFPYQDISDDSTTLPPSTSMQRCHPSAHGNSRWIKPAPPCTSLLSDCAACLCAPQACGPTLRISDGT